MNPFFQTSLIRQYERPILQIIKHNNDFQENFHKYNMIEYAGWFLKKQHFISFIKLEIEIGFFFTIYILKLEK